MESKSSLVALKFLVIFMGVFLIAGMGFMTAVLIHAPEKIAKCREASSYD